MTTNNTGTITPTSDSIQIIDRTSLAIGNLVQSVDDGRNGTVIEINWTGNPAMVFVRWDDSSRSPASVLRLRRV